MNGAESLVRTSTSSASVGADSAAAVQAANTAPGQIATLILPAAQSATRFRVLRARHSPAPDAK